MRVRNESERAFIIKGIRLEKGRVMEIAEEEGKKLCETYKGELVSLDNFEVEVVVPAEVKEVVGVMTSEETEAKKTTKKKAKK